MSTTIQAESFAANNIHERGQLDAAVDPATDGTHLTLVSTQGFATGQTIYIGTLGQDGCEGAVIQSVAASGTGLTLATELKLPHASFEPVTAVLGDLIHIYRAANIDGSVPVDSAFSVLATRSIDPDQQSTFYTDSSGSSSWWYRVTYYNATTGDETSPSASTPVRGDDFGHYASLTAIRKEAGFDNAYNLNDTMVDQQRRAAETEVNTALAGSYTVPFTKPIPQAVQSITIQLGAALLQSWAYNGTNSAAETRLKDVRAALQGLASKAGGVTDDQGVTLATAGSVDAWPNDTTADIPVEEGGGDRVFHVGDIF